ncbi:tetratricopeptide repeat protein [uncultured Proteiniphilum sp.]|uniref:tetratricopeptide repeat protein n=1 Tax=uncultured Proteiniphilum sp. TaxID=497637 RepID=UPI00260614E3|nr:tetratricopeptide repeat protein [uncultured Proteiniphilum sp.]
MTLRSIFFSLLLLHSGCLLSQSNEVQDALRNYQYNKALGLLDQEPPIRENLLLKATCYEKLYNYTFALGIYKQLVEEYPDDTNVMISMAECASQAGDSRLSLQSWITADSLSPDNLFIQTQKAMAFYRNNNWAETIEQATTVFKTDSVPLLLRMVGDAYLYSSEGDSAIWYYSKAIGKNPGDYLAVNKLGNIYLGAKFYDAAINLTETYLEKINPGQQLVGQLNGMAHYSAGNYKEATQRLKENVALGDSSYTTCYYLGMSLYAGKLYYEAVSWLEKAYGQNNTDINLLYYYGTALSRTYDRKRGIEVLTEGVEKIEEMNAMLFDFDRSFADAYMRSKNYVKAIEYFQSAYKRNPGIHFLLYNIAYCYDSMNEYKNAITYYERFLKTSPKDRRMEANDLIEEVDSGKISSAETSYRNASLRIEKLKEELFFQSTGSRSKE